MSDETFNNEMKLQPGDNPNKANARGRKNYRPRTKNQPASIKSDVTSTAFADPTPGLSIPTIGGIVQTKIKSEIGSFELDLETVQRVSRPYVEIARGAAVEYNIPNLTEAAEALETACFLQVARQIYETFLDAQKSTLQPLKAVYYWKAQLPDGLVPILSIFGDIETKLGRFNIKYPELTFLRLVMLARMNYDEEFDDVPFVERLEIAMNTYWDTNDLEQFVKDRANNFLELQLGTERAVVIGDANVTVKARRRGPAETREAYTRYLQVLGVPGNLIGCINFAFEVTAMNRLDHAHVNGDALLGLRESLGITPARDRYSIAQMRDWLSTFTNGYDNVHRYTLGQLFKVSEMPVKDTGRLAQLVRKGEGEMLSSTILPMADTDAFIGFCVYPAKSVQFAPGFNIISVSDTRDTMWNDYAKQARKLGNM